VDTAIPLCDSLDEEQLRGLTELLLDDRSAVDASAAPPQEQQRGGANYGLAGTCASPGAAVRRCGSRRMLVSRRRRTRGGAFAPGSPTPPTTMRGCSTPVTVEATPSPPRRCSTAPSGPTASSSMDHPRKRPRASQRKSAVPRNPVPSGRWWTGKTRGLRAAGADQPALGRGDPSHPAGAPGRTPRAAGSYVSVRRRIQRPEFMSLA
jgi:hypothetical protein